VFEEAVDFCVNSWCMKTVTLQTHRSSVLHSCCSSLEVTMPTRYHVKTWWAVVFDTFLLNCGVEFYGIMLSCKNMMSSGI